jgi:O-antigen/teichoic acid export membrane protein
LFGIDAAHTWSLASRRTTLGRALGNAVIWIILLSLFAVPTYLLAARVLDPEKVRDLLPVLGITAVIIPLILARFFLLACFLGLRQIDRYNILNVASQVLLLMMLVGVLLVARGGTREAVWAYATSILLLTILALAWLLRHKEANDPVRLDPALARSSLWYGIRGYGASLFGQMTYRFDQILVTQIAGITQQGFYSIAVLLAEKLTHVTNSIQLVLFPQVSASTHEEANKITAAACRHALFWVGCAGLLLFLIRRQLVQLLYGSEFLPALLPLAILLPGIFLLSFSKVLSVDLSGRNRRFPSTVAMGVAMLVNIALNLVWIPKHGMVGAAWASTLSYGLQSVIMIAFFLRITGVPFRMLIVPQRGDLELYRRILSRLFRRGES